jgi:phospholipase/lecithinase/hemolysin
MTGVKGAVRVTGVACALALLAQPAAAHVSALYVFGDSLVDAGNIEIAVFPADPSPAALGYFPGRFSNGPTFADVLHQLLFRSLSVPSLAGGTNFAFGGAKAITDADASPDLTAQRLLFTAATGGVADPNALYFINVGGNDAIAMASGAPIPAGAPGASIAANIAALAALGARDFLVANVVDVGVTPLLAGNPAAGRAASTALNAGLKVALDALVLPAGSRIRVFDAFAATDALRADPAAFGLPGLDLSTPCIAILAGPLCSNLFFMDNVHPTAVVHELFGRQLFSVVPAPASVALFGLSALALGLFRRHRRA